MIKILILKRNTHFNEFYRCGISGELITYGDWYYEDDEDHLIVKAEIYKQIKDKYREDTFDYSYLNTLQSEEEYRQKIKEMTRVNNYASLLSRKVYKG